MKSDLFYKTLLELPTPRYFPGDGTTFRKVNSLLVDLYEDALMRSQYFSQDELFQIQRKRLRRLLRYVKKSIPFYSSFLSKKVVPEICMIPPVSKSEMRSAYD